MARDVFGQVPDGTEERDFAQCTAETLAGHPELARSAEAEIGLRNLQPIWMLVFRESDGIKQAVEQLGLPADSCEDGSRMIVSVEQSELIAVLAAAGLGRCALLLTGASEEQQASRSACMRVAVVGERYVSAAWREV